MDFGLLGNLWNLQIRICFAAVCELFIVCWGVLVGALAAKKRLRASRHAKAITV